MSDQRAFCADQLQRSVPGSTRTPVNWPTSEGFNWHPARGRVLSVHRLCRVFQPAAGVLRQVRKQGRRTTCTGKSTREQRATYHATMVLRHGFAAQKRFCRYLQEHPGIDLVVTATHGRGGVARLMLGSVADKVVRAAPCPVLTVRVPGSRNPTAVERSTLMEGPAGGASVFDASATPDGGCRPRCAMRTSATRAPDGKTITGFRSSS